MPTYRLGEGRLPSSFCNRNLPRYYIFQESRRDFDFDLFRQQRECEIGTILLDQNRTDDELRYSDLRLNEGWLTRARVQFEYTWQWENMMDRMYTKGERLSEEERVHWIGEVVPNVVVEEDEEPLWTQDLPSQHVRVPYVDHDTSPELDDAAEDEVWLHEFDYAWEYAPLLPAAQSMDWYEKLDELDSVVAGGAESHDVQSSGGDSLTAGGENECQVRSTPVNELPLVRLVELSDDEEEL